MKDGKKSEVIDVSSEQRDPTPRKKRYSNKHSETHSLGERNTRHLRLGRDQEGYAPQQHTNRTFERQVKLIVRN
jgi:hypothetical protein